MSNVLKRHKLGSKAHILPHHTPLPPTLALGLRGHLSSRRSGTSSTEVFQPRFFVHFRRYGDQNDKYQPSLAHRWREVSTIDAVVGYNNRKILIEPFLLEKMSCAARSHSSVLTYMKIRFHCTVTWRRKVYLQLNWNDEVNFRNRKARKLGIINISLRFRLIGHTLDRLLSSPTYSSIMHTHTHTCTTLPINLWFVFLNSFSFTVKAKRHVGKWMLARLSYLLQDECKWCLCLASSFLCRPPLSNKSGCISRQFWCLKHLLGPTRILASNQPLWVSSGATMSHLRLMLVIADHLQQPPHESDLKLLKYTIKEAQCWKIGQRVGT